MVKIHNGTPRHDGASLCKSCRSGIVVRGETLDQEIVRCGALEETIRFKVTDCTSYSERGKPSIYDMKEIAWALCTDKRTKKIGFLSPQEFSRKRDQLEDLPALKEEDY